MRSSTRGRHHVKNRMYLKWKFTVRILLQLFQVPSWFIPGQPRCIVISVCTRTHSCMSVNVLCWPSWVCRSREHFPLSFLGQCDPLLQRCAPASVQKLGGLVRHWTNSWALPRRFRPPQNLAIAGELWQPNDGHSVEFLTQSSSGKLSTQHWAGQHTGSEPIENKIKSVSTFYNITPTISKSENCTILLLQNHG